MTSPRVVREEFLLFFSAGCLVAVALECAAWIPSAKNHRAEALRMCRPSGQHQQRPLYQQARRGTRKESKTALGFFFGGREQGIQHRHAGRIDSTRQHEGKTREHVGLTFISLQSRSASRPASSPSRAPVVRIESRFSPLSDHFCFSAHAHQTPLRGAAWRATMVIVGIGGDVV